MKISEIWARIRFWKETDRLGPDIPYTHWRLHFKSTMFTLCKSKFKKFADNAEFRPGAYAMGCSRISLGRRVIIRPGCVLHANSGDEGADISIEDDAMLGPGVHIYVDQHRFDDPNIPVIDQGDHRAEPVTLKTGCWIGANALILPGVTVGTNSVIGAGSVVTKSIPDRVLAAGNPAKVIRTIGNN
jgi:acetyltransferase-like isoleucine patch superfamily enzyme